MRAWTGPGPLRRPAEGFLVVTVRLRRTTNDLNYSGERVISNGPSFGGIKCLYMSLESESPMKRQFLQECSRPQTQKWAGPLSSIIGK